MKLSYNWLSTYIDLDESPEELSHILTMLGLETEGRPEKIGGVPGNFEGVVVGRVHSVIQHPNADRLRLCQVDVGQEEMLSIVCGAPNVAEGQKVPVATVGTKLYPIDSDQPFAIKKQKVRGEVSLGMICAEDELGIGHSHDGIMVLAEDIEPGTPFRDVVELEEDYMIEVDLTPNRIDAASHYGTARDLAAYLERPLRLPEITLTAEGNGKENPIPVTLSDPERCPRYTSIYIEGITVGESPDWLKNRLTTIGLRPRNNVVDITNYVLHELGHPLHAFDAGELRKGEVVVRTLEHDQEFTTLDDETRKLKAGADLMICDGEGPQCIAGIMGGLNSSVNENTKNIFLESAYFEPGTVRKTAKRLGVSSDSSYRFERGADPHMTETAALRAADLIVQLCGGSASKMADIKLKDFPNFQVDLSVKRTVAMAGIDLSKETITDLLNRLQIEVEEDGDGDTLHLQVPPFRVDVQRPQDVMEEILRLYNYDHVEVKPTLELSLNYRPQRDSEMLRQRYADYLSGSGFYEVLTNSLVNKNLGDDHAVPIVNPLSEELAIMRQSMMPSLLEVVQYNQNRQMEDMALYEFGRVYQKDEKGYHEQHILAMVITGARLPMHWRGKTGPADLFTLTKEVERMQAWFGFEGKLVLYEHENLDYGLQLQYNKHSLVRYGKVSSDLHETYDLRQEVFYLEVDWERLTAIYYGSDVKYQPIPVFPASRRDISMLIDRQVSFQEITDLIKRANPKLIRSIDLHDIYQGKNIEADKKSYLVSVEFRDDKKTLEDKSIDKTMERVYGQLKKNLGAVIR
ncbi:MAG: phenylalanine--tRNA ligase subunit beta [Bacteroidota bacterium]